MNKNQEAFIVLLSQLTRLVKTLRDDDLEQIVSGSIRLELKGRGSQKVEKKTGRPLFDKKDIPDFVKRLKALNSREHGYKALDDVLMTKSDLLAIAKHIDLPASVKDSNDMLRDKIIESTIGFQLRSNAIKRG